jgi:hypothetical protein
MVLREFLLHCKKLIEENPDALNMECFTEEGSSGSLSELSHPFVDKISRWDDSEYSIGDMLPNDYPFDSVVRIYVGN